MTKRKMKQGFNGQFTFLTTLSIILTLVYCCEKANYNPIVMFIPAAIEFLIRKCGYRFLSEIGASEALILAAITLKLCGVFTSSWLDIIFLFALIKQSDVYITGRPIIEKIEKEKSASGN